jgi:hypothetical protein
VKPISMFSFKNRALGKRGSTCLACMAAYSREHYARNREKYLEKAHRSRGRLRAKNDERILSYLLGHPCVDCGETDPLVLDFDHREPSTKGRRGLTPGPSAALARSSRRDREV